MAATRTHPATPARRQVILDAALAVFLARGIAGASIEEIRERSGASIGSIYHHFGGKDALADELYGEILADYQEGLIDVLQAADGARAGVEGAVLHHLAWVAANRDRARFLLTGRRARREQNRRFFGRVNAWLAPHLASGELREMSDEARHALWLGPSQEISRHWLQGTVRRRPSEDASLLAAAAWLALSNKEKKNP